MIMGLPIDRPTSGDIVVILLCLSLIPASLLAVNREQTRATAVRITAPGKPPAIYPLHPDRRIEVKGRLGPVVIELRDGQARFAASSCSGQQCVLSGWHTHSGDGMACLPNHVTLTLIAEDERFDGMNF